MRYAFFAPRLAALATNGLGWWLHWPTGCNEVFGPGSNEGGGGRDGRDGEGSMGWARRTHRILQAVRRGPARNRPRIRTREVPGGPAASAGGVACFMMPRWGRLATAFHLLPTTHSRRSKRPLVSRQVACWPAGPINCNANCTFVAHDSWSGGWVVDDAHTCCGCSLSPSIINRLNFSPPLAQDAGDFSCSLKLECTTAQMAGGPFSLARSLPVTGRRKTAAAEERKGGTGPDSLAG